MNTLSELNIDIEDYKMNELFNFAAWLHCEEFPSALVHRKKKMVVETIANQLSVEPKEIYWMLDAREKRRLKEKMGERERENTAMETNNQNWELLTREVKILCQQNNEIIHQNECILKALNKMEAKIEMEVEEKK